MALAMCTVSCALFTPAFSEEILSSEAFEDRHSQPAVSGLNGKISIGYLAVNFEGLNTTGLNNPFPDVTEEGIFSEASVSVPIGERFGFQLDGAYGSIGGTTNIDYHGVGGHLFWRNPERALLGLYAHYTEYGNDISTYQVAVEGELYFERTSLEFLAGLDVVNTVFRDDEYFAGEAIFAYYPTDNLRLSAGVRHALNTSSLVLGAEAMVSQGRYAPSFFVDASIDEDKTTSVSAGIRLYFGGSQKSLIRRHREDDPKVRLQATSDAFGRCLSKTNSGIFTGEGCRRGTASQDAGGTELASSASGNGVDPMTTGSTNASGGGATATTGTSNTTTTGGSQTSATGGSSTSTTGGSQTSSTGGSSTSTTSGGQTSTTGGSSTSTTGGGQTSATGGSNTSTTGGGQTSTTGGSGTTTTGGNQNTATGNTDTTNSGGGQNTSSGSTGTPSSGNSQTGTDTTNTTGSETTVQEPAGVPAIIPFVLDSSGSDQGNAGEGSASASSGQTPTTSMDMSQTFPEPPGLPEIIPFRLSQF